MRKRSASHFLFFIFVASVCSCGGSIGAGNLGIGAGNPSASTPTTVTFTITGVTPTNVATKIGSGPFTTVSPKSGVVNITVPSNETAFAIAYFCTVSLSPSGNAPSEVREQDVFEATTLDGNSFSGACLPGFGSSSATAPAQLTGSIDASAVSGVSSLVVAAGNVDFNFPFTNASSFGFATASGTDRVLVLAYDNVSSPPALSGSTTLEAAKSFANQTVPGALNGGNTVVLGLQDETTPVAISFGNLPSGFAIDSSSASFLTSDGRAILIAEPATKQYPALPKNSTESGDYYSIFMDASNGQSGISVTKNLTLAASVALIFPPGWSYAGPTPAPQPTFNVAYSGFSSSQGVSYGAAWNWSPSGSGIQYSASVTATRNFLNGTTVISMPDLSGLAGALSTPATGDYVNWDVGITQTAYESQPATLANSTVTNVGNSGTYEIP